MVLRTWPIHESDQIVSLFTRDFGRIKGIAKSAARSRRRFGGALEPMTHVRAHFVEKPAQELVQLDSFEILHSPLAEPVDYPRAIALAFFAEVAEQTLPEQDPNELMFRLLLSVLDETRVGQIWMPVTYFALWTTRLLGWMPDLSRCLDCGEPLAERPAYYHAYADGLFCAEHRLAGEEKGRMLVLAPEALGLAARIFRSPASSFVGEAWPRSRGADLRRFAIQSLERHLERRLRTALALSRLGTS